MAAPKNRRIYQLIYRNTAPRIIDHEIIQKILADAKIRNDNDGITGLLVVRGDTFIQLLEGDKDKVTATFRRIEKDKRHVGVKILREGATEEKLFPMWAMGIVDERLLAKSTPKVLESIDLIAKSDGGFRDTILKILKTFSTNQSKAK